MTRTHASWIALVVLNATFSSVVSGFLPFISFGSEQRINSHLCEQKERRTRRASINRKPKFYWSSIDNVEREFRSFWEDLNVTVHPTRLPTIPNQALLVHLNRNDLRSVIDRYGGRKMLAEDLGGAEVMSGRWKVAVNESSALKQLILQSPHLGLSFEGPPPSPIQLKARAQRSNCTSNEEELRESRKPRSYWSISIVVKELYEYLDECHEKRNRPAVWMPQAAEIGESGRHSLQQCLFRFGGQAKICRLCGLIPFREWLYFEGQLDLLKDLKKYLDEYHHGDYSLFPVATDIQNHGYDSLYILIQRYGGRQALASRFNMKYLYKGGNRGSGNYEGAHFGVFSLTFAVDLLEFVRADQMKLKAPLKVPAIRMPSKYKLETAGRVDLIQQIDAFGGYENVARRLRLAYFL